MVTASYINRLSQAVEQIETRLKQNRSWKVVTVRCGYHEDRNVARGRHYAAHQAIGSQCHDLRVLR